MRVVQILSIENFIEQANISKIFWFVKFRERVSISKQIFMNSTHWNEMILH